MNTEEPSEKKLTRVGFELRDMYHQLFLGTLLGTIFRVLTDVVGILLLAGATYYFLELALPASQCVRSGFKGEPENACWFAPSFLFRLFILLLALSVGSFFSTKHKKAQKFQHSSCVTGGLLIVILGSLIGTSYPLSAIFFAFIAIFSFSYFGYRFWFYLRDRNK